MGVSPLCVLSVALAVGAGPNPRPPIEPAGPRSGGNLGAEDARFLDSLMEDFLFDPKRAAAFVRVRVATGTDRLVMRGDSLLERGTSRDGWLVRGTNGDPDRVYFTDGESMVSPAVGIRQISLPPVRERRRPSSPDEELLELVRSGSGVDTFVDGPLVRAAWLHRLGYEMLAAAALTEARESGDDPVATLRVRLAGRANDAAVRAFVDRNDTEAVAHAARLFALYPDLAGEYGVQAREVAADIQRRARSGIGSRVPPAGPPADFATWDERKKIAFLIASLDELASVGDRWDGFSNHLDADWRCAALYVIGDPAVPALIDALEHDTRLTRQRDRMRQLLCCGNGIVERPEQLTPVRTVIQRILETILRTSDYDPTGPPEGGEEGSPAAQVDRLRRYWARYGRLPLPDRMMAILTEPASRSISRALAAGTLAGLPEPEPSWSRNDRRPVALPRPSPVAFRFTGPTVAEAIFAAMDRDRAEPTKDAPWMRATYLRALTELGDPRAGPELARRANAATKPIDRLQLAEAAAQLGTTGPLVELAREVTTGTVRLPPPEGSTRRQPRDVIRQILEDFLSAGLPETEEALYAVADPHHPYFPVASRAVLIEPQFRVGQTDWNRHPVCLAILRAGLADGRPTGQHAYRRGPDIEEAAIGGPPRIWTPPGGADPSEWFEHVQYTAAAEAAARAGDMLIGLPEYHPLRRDADRVLAETRAVLLRHGRHARPLTWEEGQRLQVVRAVGTTFVPDIRPLGRPATAADVAAGRAVFALPNSRVADVKLPAWVILKGDTKSDPSAGLVVQAELGPDGKLVYGAIFRHAIRMVRADEVERIEPAEGR